MDASAPPAEDRAAYSVLAEFYDRVLGTAFDYRLLGRHVAGIIRRFSPDPARILELGAGTCPLAQVKAYPRSAKVVYSDLSPQMLARAPGRCPRCRVAADARAIPFKGPFDICVMLMDAINYLLEEEDVSRCIRETLRILRPGGLFILNVAGETACRGELADISLSGRLADCEYSIRSGYDARTRRLETRFIIAQGPGPDSPPAARECHVQRIYDLSTIRRLALAEGFEVAGCFAGHTFRRAREDAEVIHFALKKPASDGFSW